MQITTMPQSGTIQEGEDLELECNVKSKPASTFKWFFQGDICQLVKLLAFRRYVLGCTSLNILIAQLCRSE